MSALVRIDVVSAELAKRIEEVCRAIGLSGGPDGHGEWQCLPTAQGGEGDSFKVHIGQDGRRGVWKHFASGEAGDALDLVAYVLFASDISKALAWARAWLGYDAAPPAPEEQRRLAARAREAEAAEAERRKRKRAAAFKLWLEAQVSVAGTPVETYLRDRGIDLRALGRQPGALRFHPRVHRYEENPVTKRHEAREAYPAMLLSIVNAAGETIGCHRTYLAAHADGRVTKATLPDGSKAKKSWGDVKGGWISLWKGQLPNGRQGKRFADLVDADAGAWVDPDTGEVTEEHANNSVHVSEGAEDGLTVAVLDPRLRVIAAVSVGNLKALALPPAIKFVTIVRQDDSGNPRALRATSAAIAAAIARWHGEGRTVYVIDPPRGFKDINDQLAGKPLEGAA
jgi:hypothetical protein